MAHWYRATCFGVACGPWRTSLREVRADLVGQGLGSYDETGQFYVTVPGGIDRESDWMDYAVWQASHCRPVNPASATPARSRGRQLYKVRHHSAKSSDGRDYWNKAPSARDR